MIRPLFPCVVVVALVLSTAVAAAQSSCDYKVLWPTAGVYEEPNPYSVVVKTKQAGDIVGAPGPGCEYAGWVDSTYNLTYGRDESGQSRWSRDLDHSATTAICGIHPKGKPPQAAAAEIARTVARIMQQRRSGVALKASVESD